MIKGIVFDMDGLMFDTERLAVKAWNFAGKQMGYRFFKFCILFPINVQVCKKKCNYPKKIISLLE